MAAALTTLLLGMNPMSAQEDLDCVDFATQEEAQAVLDEDPGDPNNLDPNGDGFACSLLPSAAEGGAEPGGGDIEPADSVLQEEGGDNREPARNRGEAAEDLDCADFETLDDAQAVLDEDPGDPHRLDPDEDGVACEDEELEEEDTGDRNRGAQRDETARPTEEPDQGDTRNRNRDGQRDETAQPTEEPEAPEDRDCGEFEFQEQAQRVLDEDPDDPFGLDPDADGVACEELPTRRGDGNGQQDEVDRPTEDLDCADFEFQEEAQAVLDEDPGDPNNLDPSGDGFACSELPSESGEVRVNAVPRTGAGTVAGEGRGQQVPLAAHAALLATGAVAIAGGRRRSARLSDDRPRRR